jgi:hypothetical protein
LDNTEQNTSGFPDLEGIPNIGKVMGLLQKMDKTSTPEDNEILKQEMNTFLQNDLGIDMNNFNEQLEEVTKKIMENNKVD